MLKLNTSGLLKKCKELWSWLTSFISAKKEEIVLDSLKEFCEGYIGIIITGFNSYHDDIKDIEDKIQAKMIVSTIINDDELYLKLVTAGGKHGGYLKLSPEINGQFAEREDIDEPNLATRYRINFYGGDSFEYIDPDTLGTITYHDGFIR